MSRVRKYEFPGRELQEARVVALVEMWRDRMDLSHMDISNVFIPSLHGEEDGGDAIDDTAALTAGDWQYRSATITWHLPCVAVMTDRALEEVVVHELCHVLLCPLAHSLKVGSEKLEELATENVARALLRYRDIPGA